MGKREMRPLPIEIYGYVTGKIHNSFQSRIYMHHTIVYPYPIGYANRQKAAKKNCEYSDSPISIRLYVACRSRVTLNVQVFVRPPYVFALFCFLLFYFFLFLFFLPN